MFDWILSYLLYKAFLGPRVIYDREFKGDEVYRITTYGRTVGLVVKERRPRGRGCWAAYRGHGKRCKYVGNFTTQEAASVAAKGW